MQELEHNYSTVDKLVDDLGENLVLYFYQKNCPMCVPMKELLISLASSYEGLTLYSVCATGENLTLCSNLDIDRTPSVVVIISGSCGFPQCDPARVTEEVKKAANAQNRKENSSS